MLLAFKEGPTVAVAIRPLIVALPMILVGLELPGVGGAGVVPDYHKQARNSRRKRGIFETVQKPALIDLAWSSLVFQSETMWLAVLVELADIDPVGCLHPLGDPYARRYQSPTKFQGLFTDINPKHSVPVVQTPPELAESSHFLFEGSQAGVFGT